MATVQKTKAKKVGGEKKQMSHPPYAEMIKEAIVFLKERAGSSSVAIAKFIDDKHKLQQNSPNYKKLLLSNLKKLVASGHLIKVKNSFKLGASTKSNGPKKTVKKPKKVVTVKTKKPKTGSSPAKVKKPVVKKRVATPVAVKAKKVVKKANAVAKKPKSIKANAVAKKPKSIKSPMKKKTVTKAKK